MGSKTVAAPKPSEEELELRREETELLRFQRELLEEQVRQQDLLAPFLFDSLGLTPVFEEVDGEQKIVGFEQEGEDPADIEKAELRESLELDFLRKSVESLNNPEVDENENLRRNIERQFLERSQRALSGEVPVNPGLIRSLDEAEQDLRERLQAQLGPGFETSTPGIQALAEFDQRKQEILEGARRDDLTLSEQLGLAREQAGFAREGAFLDSARLFDSDNLTRTASFLNNARGVVASQGDPGFAGVAAGFGRAGGAFANDRQLEFQAAVQNAQNAGSGARAFGSLLGTVGGAFVGSPAFGKLVGI